MNYIYFLILYIINMGFIKDIENEFNASNNNTTEKYNNNELFSLTTIDSKEGPL